MAALQTPGDRTAFNVHPERGRVLSEVHARPLMPIDAPRRVLHFGFMTDHWAAAKDRAAFEEFCIARARPAPAPDAKHHRIEVPPAILRWEHHGEFTTYTWEFPSPAQPGNEHSHTPFWPGPDELSNLMHLLPQPGPLLIAVDLHLLPERAVGEVYRHLFGPEQLAASEVENGAARVATDFHPDAFGFVRILVLDRKLTPAQAGGLVQRLLEIETYRTLALLGLPQAQQLGPTIRRIETELPLLMNEMRESQGFEANKHLLDKLTALAGDLETGAAHSLFRFGATRAYHEMIGHRLDAINEKVLPSLPTLAAFLSRRLTPAIRTCAATEARQDNLSRKLARAAQLLRTRVDIELESQNGDLLRKMNDRARMQLRLQQTVEGLSIVALTYYLTSICHIAFEGIHREVVWLDPTIATAIALPFVFIIVALMVARIRRHYVDE
jgi:uncharacterized membrane-anchored protein